jgi:8-oxo-dGTP pyrophosphatase MutT (NUDIX family)
VEAKVKKLWEALQVKTVKEKIRQTLSQREEMHVEIEGFTPTAVLVPVYEKTGEYYIIVTKRTEEVNNHKGQISFPGGRCHAEDKTLRDTALRESWEEIGLDPDDVDILGELDDVFTATTKFIISPFVAAIPYPYKFTASPLEVEEIIEVPLAVLLDRSNFSEELKLHEDELIPDYSYKYGERVIWGATARILKQFLELVFGA